MAHDPGADGAPRRDEGLAPERTQLAWGRTGLALVVAVGVLARRVWSLVGPVEILALVVVGVGSLVWSVGMRLSRDCTWRWNPTGCDGRTGPSAW